MIGRVCTAGGGGEVGFFGREDREGCAEVRGGDGWEGEGREGT